MRKHVYYLSALLLALSACGSGSFETDDIEENTATAENPVNKNKGPLGDVLFKDTVFMFGDVKDGESVQHTYTFKNTGVAPISIAKKNPNRKEEKIHATPGCNTNPNVFCSTGMLISATQTIGIACRSNFDHRRRWIPAHAINRTKATHASAWKDRHGA